MTPSATALQSSAAAASAGRRRRIRAEEIAEADEDIDDRVKSGGATICSAQECRVDV